MHLLAAATIVCGAWFGGLPAGWQQSGLSVTRLSNGVTHSNAGSWAANFRSARRYGLRRFPRDGVYVWVSLARPQRQLSGNPLRVPLRLRDAKRLILEGTSNLPEYRFEGRYARRYQVVAGVDFGRPRPTRRMTREAASVLRRIVFPRWLPKPDPCPG
jgi:hypothetical protein